MILVEATDAEARVVIDRIDDTTVDGARGPRASFGVAVFEQQGSSDDLFRRADEAMYLAKRSDGSVAVAA
jgi:GGDEF domain-containing protein